MDYFQNVCAKNILTSFLQLKELVSNGIKHFHLNSNHNKSFLLDLKTQNFFKNKFSNLVFDFYQMLEDHHKILKGKSNV